MSTKYEDDYDDDEEEDEDDEDEEDEGDFIPGMDDDDDLDDDFEDENLDDQDDDPYLQGHIFLNDDRKIVLHGDDVHLVSEESAPPSFSLSKPALENHIIVSGTLKNATLKMEVKISKNDPTATIDPLEQHFLDQQAVKQEKLETVPSNSKLPAGVKQGDDEEDQDENMKQAPKMSMGGGKKAAAVEDVYVFQATQIATDPSGSAQKIRAVFHPLPASSSATSLYIMAVVRTSQADAPSSVAAAASPAKPAAAVSRKRGRHDEEDEDDGDDGVGYQELIDLHDDAGLSTEELRRRYYSGSKSEPKTKMPKAPPAAEESDDDDAYGF